MLKKADSEKSETTAAKILKNGYTADALFENWTESFSLYELYQHEDGKEDLKIIAANKTFANLIGADYNTLAGRLFTDACRMAIDWLPFYIQTAKTGKGNIQESYNQDLKKYLNCCVFSPRAGQVALLVTDRTSLWMNDQALRTRNNELAALFSSMTSGFCVGKIVRDEQGNAIDFIFEMVNAAFQILEGFPTSFSLPGKRLFEVRENDEYFDKYIQVADQKTKTTFIKHIALNKRILEVICFSQVDDVLVCIENDVTERVTAVENLKNAYKTIAEQNQTILASIRYASKIQKNLLPREQAFHEIFTDYSILWKPKDIVGGDIYWLNRFQKGALLCVCDCTGHGTPGALLTMLIASTLEDIADESNCDDTAQLVYRLDQRIAAVLNVDTEMSRTSAVDALNNISDGCDLALLFIHNDGSVSISSGNIHVFVCDGKDVRKIKGQRLCIGEGKLRGKDDVKTVTLPADSSQKFYVASDGLYDQIGGEPPHPLGYNAIQALILQNHEKPLRQISDLIWGTFEAHRGSQVRRDDVELVSFQV